jgi:peptidoglycan/LPS O-acetylase OafA/YrhL
MLIVTALMNIFPEHRSQWLYLVVLVGGTSMGLLSWHLVERPAMNFVRRNRPLALSRQNSRELWPDTPATRVVITSLLI